MQKKSEKRTMIPPYFDEFIVFLVISTVASTGSSSKLFIKWNAAGTKEWAVIKTNKMSTSAEAREECLRLGFDGIFAVRNRREASEFNHMLRDYLAANPEVMLNDTIDFNFLATADDYRRVWAAQFWLGVWRDASGVWKYSSHENVTSYQPWDPVYPVDDLGADCVVARCECFSPTGVAWRSNHSVYCTLQWEKINCGALHSIVCERKGNRSALSNIEYRIRSITKFTPEKTENITKEILSEFLSNRNVDAATISRGIELLHNISKTDILSEVTESSFRHVMAITEIITRFLTRGEAAITNDQSNKITRMLECFLSRVQIGNGEISVNFSTAAFTAEVRYVDNARSSEFGRDVETWIRIPRETMSRADAGEGAGGRSRVSFISYPDDTLFMSQYNVTNVVAAQINNQKISNLTSPVVYSIALQPRTSNKEIRFVQCVAWDYTASTWNDSGCRWVEVGSSGECRCNHMTNFAILVQTRQRPATPLFEKVNFCIGAISCICFFMTAAIYLIFRDLRDSAPGPLHIHLSTSLLLSYLLLLIGANRTDQRYSCILFAALTHYFLLVSWMWMLAEGFTMYKLLVRKHQSLDERFLYYCTLLAYTLPAVIVGVTVGLTVGVFDNNPLLDRWWRVDGAEVYESHYVSNSYCWLQGNALYFSYLLLQGLIVLTNFIMCIVVLRSITWGRKKIQSNRLRESPCNQVCMIFTITFLLGLVWFVAIPLSALSQVPPLTEVLNYTVSILISCQGIAMFYLFCVRNKKAFELWTAQIVRLLVKIPGCGGIRALSLRKSPSTRSSTCTRTESCSHSPPCSGSAAGGGGGGGSKKTNYQVSSSIKINVSMSMKKSYMATEERVPGTAV